MASRDEDLSMSCKPAVLEHSLTEAATAFPPSGLGQVTAALPDPYTHACRCMALESW